MDIGSVIDIDKSGISSFLSHADLELLFCFSPQCQFCTLDFLKNVFDKKRGGISRFECAPADRQENS